MSKRKGRRKEELMYEPIAEWLGSAGFTPVITGGTGQVYLPTGSLLGVRFVEPDVVGYRGSGPGAEIAIVEAKGDPMYLFDGIGRCSIFRLIADLVYLAMPQDFASKVRPDTPILKELGIGLLSVSEKKAELLIESRKDERWYGDPSLNNLRELLMRMVGVPSSVPEM